MFCRRKTDIILECRNEWLNCVIDHFGCDAEVEQISEEAFRIKANVQLSPTFYAWLFEAGTKVKIIEPTDVVEEYTNLLRDIIEEYT